MKSLLQHLRKINRLGIHLLSMSLFTTIASCETCGSASKRTQPQLVLSSDQAILPWFAKDFQIILHNEGATPANLSEYTLKISLEEEGSTGSKLKYQASTHQKYTESSIEQPVSHFVQQAALEKAHGPITIPFELITTPKSTRITIQVSLKHPTEHISPITVVWEGLKKGFQETKVELEALEEAKKKLEKETKKYFEPLFRKNKDEAQLIEVRKYVAEEKKYQYTSTDKTSY